jgi:hypothetical protein
MAPVKMPKLCVRVRAQNEYGVYHNAFHGARHISATRKGCDRNGSYLHDMPYRLQQHDGQKDWWEQSLKENARHG